MVIPMIVIGGEIMVRLVPVLGLLGHYHGHSSAVFHGHLPQQV